MNWLWILAIALLLIVAVGAIVLVWMVVSDYRDTPKSWQDFESLDPKTRAAIRKGLEQAANGWTRHIGSFAQYAEDEDEQDFEI